MTQLQVTAVPAFEDNYLWLVHGITHPRQVIAVDPGDADAINAALKQQDLQLAGILVTHRHMDHVGGVVALQSAHGVPLYGSAHEPIPGEVTPVTDGMTVEFAELGLKFAVLAVPGHTSGHVAYLGHGAVFCGDTLFSAGCGRLLGGTAPELAASLARLAQLPENTDIYCAHEYTVANLRFAQAVEPDNSAVAQYLAECQARRDRGERTVPSKLALELKINPFLRLAQESVKRAAAQHGGRSLHRDVETFTVLREWKNQFRV